MLSTRQLNVTAAPPPRTVPAPTGGHIQDQRHPLRRGAKASSSTSSEAARGPYQPLVP
jgi:hypothetical protein